MQVPFATKFTVVPDTVHTEGVPELKVTGRLEDAVAETVTGIWSGRLSAKGSKVIAWSCLAVTTTALVSEVVASAAPPHPALLKMAKYALYVPPDAGAVRVNDSVYVPGVVRAVVLAHVYAPGVAAIRHPVDRQLLLPVRFTVIDPAIEAEGAAVVAAPPFTVTPVIVAAANVASGDANEARISAAWTSAMKRQRREDRVEVAGTLHSRSSIG